MVLHHWDIGQFYVLLINCISCCPIIAIYFCSRNSVKRVTNEKHKGQTLPFSICCFKFSAALSLALMQVEEEWPVIQTSMLILNSVSDSSAFEKTILIYESFFTLTKYSSRIFTLLWFMNFSNKLFNALLPFASRDCSFLSNKY